MFGIRTRSMKSEMVTESEMKSYLSRPFNPPQISETFTKEAFYNEWGDAKDSLKNALAQLGRHNSFGDGDFCVADDYELSRGVSVELSSTRLMTPALIPTVASVLQSLPQPYSVYIDHGVLDIPLFFLVIERGRVMARETIPGVLRRFNIVDKIE